MQALSEGEAHLLFYGLCWGAPGEVERSSNLLRVPVPAAGPLQVTHGTVTVRGDYDAAIFQAFKQVEVAVRDAASFRANDIGVSLMRAAFHTDNGPLRDSTAVTSERRALSDLSAGAIGAYKNPHTHRNVALDDPHEAAEVTILASHLLKIVDSRQPGGSA